LVKLVPFSQEYIDKSVEWHSDEEIAKRIGIWVKYTQDEIRYVIDSMANNPATKIFGIDSNGKAIGYALLKNIDYKNHSAESHITIGDKASWKTGRGFIAYENILAYGFKDLGLNRVQTFVISDNKELVKLMEKKPFGFQQEGVLRQVLARDGEYLDVIVYGLLKKEFTQRRKLWQQ